MSAGIIIQSEIATTAMIVRKRKPTHAFSGRF
jgi:hypothetical protein